MVSARSQSQGCATCSQRRKIMWPTERITNAARDVKFVGLEGQPTVVINASGNNPSPKKAFTTFLDGYCHQPYFRRLFVLR